MTLPEFGVRRPITNLMIFIGIVVISLYSLWRLGIDMMPEIEPPAITVVSIYPGASPEDVEAKVTEPLENQLASTPGMDRLTSRSVEGVSAVTLKFNWGIDMDEASNDVRDRIELAKRFLPDIPDEMETPFVFKFNTAMMPMIVMGVSAGQSYMGLNDLFDRRVADPLRQIPGVGAVQINGGLERQINVWIDRERLEGHGISILDVRKALAAENVTQPAGNVKTGLTDYLLRLPGEFASPDEINSVILGRKNGKMVYLKDVARVEDGFEEVSQIARVNRNNGLIVTIQKQVGVNTVKVAEKVKARLKELEKSLPPDVKFHIIQDYSQDILQAVGSLRSTVWRGGALVIAVTWLMLGRLRPSLIIALTIPFSLLIAFVYLFLTGRTINVVSLSALTMGIGMVVDNAIVIVENVYRHLSTGKRPEEAAIYGAREMYLAVGASTLTTIVVFAPMLFVSGIVGIMFGEMSAIMIVTLTASLFTSVTFTPMLCSKLLGRAGAPAGAGTPAAGSPAGRFEAVSQRAIVFLENVYVRALQWSFGHRKTVILGFFGFFAVGVLTACLVGTEFIPEEDTGDLRITAQLPVGTRLEESDKTARRVEDIIERDIPERKACFVRAGQARGMAVIFGGKMGSHVVSGGGKMTPKDERKRSVAEIAQALRARVRELPGVMKIDVSTGSPMGRMLLGAGGKKIQVEIIGHSFEETGRLAERVKRAVEQTPGAVDASISRDIRRPEMRIAFDREKAASLGLDMRTVSDSVKAFVEGSVASRYREGGETYDIVVRLEEASRARLEDIENFSIMSPYARNQVRLGNIAGVYEALGPIEIERQNRERVVRVECDTYGRSLGDVVADIRDNIAGISLPAGVMIRFGGEREEQVKAFKDLTLLLLLGVLLVYMVMASQFESLRDPFIVMFAVPFGFTGAVLAFALTGTTLSVITFLGLVMLTGVVVNNAIILISYIGILRERGLALDEAIAIGGKHRLRPVLMTTITTMAGLLPLALSRGRGADVWQPLGITMLGGLTISMLVTMIFVPTLYAVFEERREKARAGKHA